MYNSVSIPDIFRELVANVAVTLGYTINFKFGSWKTINEELKNEGVKYPLIALLRGWKETPEDETVMVIDDLRILIAVRSGETDREQKRNDDSYVAQIHPLYQALCNEMANSYFFTGYAFKHALRDWPNLGLEGGERLLEDCTDARLMEDVSLRVNLQECAYPKPVCMYTPCPNGRILEAITSFNSITLTGLLTEELTVTINDYDYQVAPPTLPSPFIPDIDPGDGGPVVSMDASLIHVIDVSGLPDGFYIGTITFAQAQFQFYYAIAQGRVIHHTSAFIQTLTPTYSCQEYFDTNFHSISAGLTYTLVKIISEQPKINGYSLTLFGQAPVTQAFAAVDTFTGTLTRQTKYDEGNYLIIQDISRVGGQSPLRSIAYLKTKCSTT